MPPERSAELHRTYAFILNQPRTLNSPLSILLLPVCLPLLASIISVAHHLLLNPPCRANNKYQTPRTTIPIINSPFLICKSTFIIIIINPLRAVFNLRIRIWPNSTLLWSALSIDRQLQTPLHTLRHQNVGRLIQYSHPTRTTPRLSRAIIYKTTFASKLN